MKRFSAHIALCCAVWLSILHVYPCATVLAMDLADETTQTASTPEPSENDPNDEAISIIDSNMEEACEADVKPIAAETPDPENKGAILLDLTSMQRIALADNPSLAAGAERVEQTQQLVTQARSMYYPQVDLSYTYTFTWLPSSYTDPLNEYLDQTEAVLRDWKRDLYMFTAETGQPSISRRKTLRSWFKSTDDAIESMRDYLDGPQENTTLSLTAGWLLFDGFAREYANAMARHGYGEAKAAFREGQRILLDAVAQAYYGGQFAREQVRIANSDIAFYERLYTEAVARRAVGRGSTSDVLSFETALYAAKANRLRANRDYETARLAMALLLGLEEGRLRDDMELAPLEEETEAAMTMPEADAMIALAVAHRPDLEQRELGLKRAQASVRREYAKFSPQIAAIAGAETANIDETGIQADRLVATVGVNASMNLFAGGRRKAELIGAKHERREAELRIVEAEQKIVNEVRQALLDLQTAQEALRLQLEAAECVEKNRNLVEKEYNAGKAMFVRLSQAQRDYMQAIGLLAQVRVNLQRSWQALHAATGANLTALAEKDADAAQQE